MEFITNIRNKALATVVRTVASHQIGGGSSDGTHEDEVLHIPSRDADRTIKVHVYRSKATATAPTPILINFHGSGFIIPMHGTDDEFALRIAKDTPYTVYDVQYRLAPEHPFPAAPHDAEDAVKYVLGRPQEFDLSHVSVSGFSAGGNLALGLSGLIYPKDTFRHVLGFYPPTDIAKYGRDKVAPDTSGAPLPSWMTDVFTDCYLPAGVDRKQPLASPYYLPGDVFADNVLLITCACDNLAPETEELADKIAKAAPEKHLVRRRMEHCNHAWVRMSIVCSFEVCVLTHSRTSLMSLAVCRRKQRTRPTIWLSECYFVDRETYSECPVVGS